MGSRTSGHLSPRTADTSSHVPPFLGDSRFPPNHTQMDTRNNGALERALNCESGSARFTGDLLLTQCVTSSS